MFLSLVVALTPFTHSAEPTASQPIAHRGLLKHSPENTIANFATCRLLRLGFEFDVRRAKDGALICLHDDTLDRTTNGQGKASDKTMAELFQLDAGTWFDPSFRGERIPTIDQVCKLIATAPSETALYTADLKGSDEKLEADIVALAQEHRAVSKILFIGRAIDHPEVRGRLRKADPACHVAALAQTAADVANAILDRDSNWVYLRFVPDRDLVAKINAAGKRTIIAGTTVSGEEPANWSRCVAAGVDLILTDYPLEFRAAMKKKDPSGN